MFENYELFRRCLFAFLKENNVYDRWLHNIMEQHPSTNIKWWHNYVETLYTKGCLMSIDYAFNWSETEEGYDFWDNIDTEWNSEIYGFWKEFYKKWKYKKFGLNK